MRGFLKEIKMVQQGIVKNLINNHQDIWILFWRQWKAIVTELRHDKTWSYKDSSGCSMGNVLEGQDCGNYLGQEWASFGPWGKSDPQSGFVQPTIKNDFYTFDIFKNIIMI